MAPPARYIISHDAPMGHWYVADRLIGRVVYSGTSLMPADRRAHDEEDRWRARCQRWIEAENRATTP
jgi:hypothetical protein